MSLQFWLLLNENLGVCGKIKSSHSRCDLGFVLWRHRWGKKMGGVVFNGLGVRAGEARDVLPQNWEGEMWWGHDCCEPLWFTRSRRKKTVKKTPKNPKVHIVSQRLFSGSAVFPTSSELRMEQQIFFSRALTFPWFARLGVWHRPLTFCHEWFIFAQQDVSYKWK